MTGIIRSVADHGSIVEVVVTSARRVRSVYFDHRMFAHMAEGESGEVLGRKVRVHGARFLNESIEFLA